MDLSIRDRARSEGGFTLIELLVVMIIIAILMAVAVPTFLAQKNSAVKTQATANIKQVVTAIESCATNITAGGYKDPAAGGMDCTTQTTLEGFEKSLSNLNLQTANPSAAGQYQVVLDTASNQGYMVQTRIEDSGVPVYFAEIHKSDGTLLKVCSGSPLSLTSPGGSVVAASKTCKNPKWG